MVWTPLKHISQLGWLFPIYGKIKNAPNHQPVKVWHSTTELGYCASAPPDPRLQVPHWKDHMQLGFGRQALAPVAGHGPWVAKKRSELFGEGKKWLKFDINLKFMAIYNGKMLFKTNSLWFQRSSQGVLGGFSASSFQAANMASKHVKRPHYRTTNWWVTAKKFSPFSWDAPVSIPSQDILR